MTYQTLVKGHFGISINEAVLTTSVYRTSDTLRIIVILDSCHTRHICSRRIVDIHHRLICVCHMSRSISVSNLTTGTTIDVTAIHLLGTDVTACHVDGSFTCHWSELKLIRPTERETSCHVGMLGSSCSSLRYIQRIIDIGNITY